MSEKLPLIDCLRLVRALEKAGFERVRQKGSHLHLRRATDGRRLTVPVHPGQMVPLGTLRAILRDADISPENFRELL